MKYAHYTGLFLMYVATCHGGDIQKDPRQMTPAELDAALSNLYERSQELNILPAPGVFDFCRSGDVDSLRKYLDNGGDPNFIQDKEWPYPPLLSALLSDQMACADLLIDRGADVNAPAWGHNIVTVFHGFLLNAKMQQFFLKGDPERILNTQRRIEYLTNHGAVADEAFVQSQINDAGEKAWSYSSDKTSDTIVAAECRGDSIILPTEDIKASVLDEIDSLSKWLDDQSGETNIVVAATVYPDGKQTENILFNMCLEKNVRMFTHKVLPAAPEQREINDFEQSVPGYPPQGVGSPEP